MSPYSQPKWCWRYSTAPVVYFKHPRQLSHVRSQFQSRFDFLFDECAMLYPIFLTLHSLPDFWFGSLLIIILYCTALHYTTLHYTALFFFDTESCSSLLILGRHPVMYSVEILVQINFKHHLTTLKLNAPLIYLPSIPQLAIQSNTAQWSVRFQLYLRTAKGPLFSRPLQILGLRHCSTQLCAGKRMKQVISRSSLCVNFPFSYLFLRSFCWFICLYNDSYLHTNIDDHAISLTSWPSSVTWL